MEIRAREEDNVVIFYIRGEIRRSEVVEVTLHQLVKDHLDDGKRKILLNFREVDFIDSFGVGEILASYISVHNLGGKLSIAEISERLYRVFQVTMLTKVLDIHDSEEKALESLSRS